MVWNNISFIDNTTSIAAVVEGVNNMAGGWLFGGLMITVFIISFMVFYGRVGIGEILTGNGFLLSIVGLLFIKMEVLPVWVLGITISILVFGLLSIFLSD